MRVDLIPFHSMKCTSVNVLPVFAFVVLINACTQKCADTISQNYVGYGYQSINVDDKYKVSLSYAPDYSVKATGCSEDLEGLRINVINGVLRIYQDSKEDNFDVVKVTIKAPVFYKITLNDDATCTINGFTDSTERTFILNDNSIGSYNGTASLVTVSATANTSFTIAGNIERALVDLSGDAVYDAKNTVGNQTTTITAGSKAVGTVNALDTLTATASGQSRIYYKGDPTQKNFTEISQGKILPL